MVAQSYGKIAHQPQPDGRGGLAIGTCVIPWADFSSLDQGRGLCTSRQKAALARQCGVKKTTVASTIGRSRDASRPSARERIHVQAAQEWIVWWSEGVYEDKEGVQTHIVADLASLLRREKTW